MAKASQSELVDEHSVIGVEEIVELASVARDGKYATNYRESGEVKELAANIKRVGLLTPPWVVRDKSRNLHLAAGFKRFAAVEGLGWPTIRVKVFSTDAVGAGIGQTVALLRAIENSRDEITFADRVRSIRQLISAKVADDSIASAWRVSEAYVKQIRLWDSKLPAGFEDKLSKQQAQVIACADNPERAYEEFISDGTLPEKRPGNPGRGRGAAAANLRAELFIRHPWAEQLPWSGETVKLTSPEHLAEWDKTCRVLEGLAAARLLVPRQVPAEAAAPPAAPSS